MKDELVYDDIISVGVKYLVSLLNSVKEECEGSDVAAHPINMAPSKITACYYTTR